MPVTVVGAVEFSAEENPFFRCGTCAKLVKLGTGHGHHLETDKYPTEDEMTKVGGSVKTAKTKDNDHSDRDSVTARLRKIRDIVLGREVGPLTEIRETLTIVAAGVEELKPLVGIVTGLDARLSAMDTRLAAAAKKLDAIFAAVAPDPEKATSFDISATPVPASPTPVPDTPK